MPTPLEPSVMRLLKRSETSQFRLIAFSEDDTLHPYAILSHRWLAEPDEPTFKDLSSGTGQGKAGYGKLRFCAEQAEKDGLQYFWVDTCCINKQNKAELSYAINSMFRWYRNAARCYAYLSDVSTEKGKHHAIHETISGNAWEPNFRASEWFARGWTLQELLAPIIVEFFSQEGERLGDKKTLLQQIHEITGIDKRALQGDPLSLFSVDDRLGWIDQRRTARDEDKAYSLLGIFGVHIAPLYGEGMATAFNRLREAINKFETCIKDLHITDPRNDKTRIEELKGGLLKDSYQ